MPTERSIITAGAALAAALLFTAPSSAQKKRAMTVEDLYRIGRASQLALASHDDLAAFAVTELDMETNASVSHLWIADLETGESRKLTNSEKSDWSPRWMPDGRLAFLSARSGEAQIWAIRADGGEAEQLTDLPVGIESFAVSPDGKSAAAVVRVFPECGDLECTKERIEREKEDMIEARIYERLPCRIWDTWLDGRLGHVLWVPLDGGEARDLTPGDVQTPPLDLGGHHDLSIAPDGEVVAFTANATDEVAWNTNNDVFEVSVAGGAPRNLTERNEACDAEPVYSPDGRYLAYLAMRRPGFESDRRMLVLHDRETGKRIPLTDSLDRSVSWFSWAPSSRAIVFVAPDRGRASIYKVSVPSGIVTKIYSDGTNSEPIVTRDGKGVVFLHQSLSTSADLFAISMRGSDARRLSRINEDVLDGIEMGEPEDFEFAGAGGDEVHGILLKPPGFDPRKKYPLLLLVHGGPQGAFGHDFHPRWNMQLFATPGFVVAAVNFHGSRGWGQEFCDSVSGDWGGKPYEDLMKGVDYVIDTYPFVDGDNVSAAGASYGGFMINWILGHTDRFRSLVSHDGVYDQVSMYGSTEELWFPEWEMKGTPWDAPRLYEEHSPSKHAARFATPTLVVHGESDYRVPYTQGLQIFTALQRRGVESKLLFFPDENHFVRKPRNARLWWHTVLGWLADHAGLRWTPPGAEDKPRPGAKKRKKKLIAG